MSYLRLFRTSLGSWGIVRAKMPVNAGGRRSTALDALETPRSSYEMPQPLRRYAQLRGDRLNRVPGAHVFAPLASSWSAGGIAPQRDESRISQGAGRTYLE